MTNEDAIAKTRTVTFLSVLAGFLVAGHSLVSPSLPLYALSLGVDLGLVGFVVTAFAIGRLGADIPTGWLGDRIGRRPFFLLGASMVVVSSLAAASISDFGLLIGARFLQGAGSAVFSTTALTAIIDLSTAQTRARAMSTYQGSLYLGAASGPVLGGFIADRFGFHAPFLAMAAIGALTFVWTFLAMPETRQPRDVPAFEPSAALTPKGHTTDWSGLAAISLLNVVFFAVRSGTGSTGLPLVSNQRFGLSASEIGELLGLSIVINLGFLLIAGRLLTSQNMIRLLVLSTVVAAVGVSLYAVAGDLTAFVVATVLFSMGTGLGVPIPPTYAASRAPAGSYGLSAGLFRTSVDLGQGIGPIAASQALVLRGPELLFGASGILMILATAAFVRLSGLRSPARVEVAYEVSP